MRHQARALAAMQMAPRLPAPLFSALETWELRSSLFKWPI